MSDKKIAIVQVLLLVVSIMAFGFIFGSEVKVVSAFNGACDVEYAGNIECSNSISYKCTKNNDGKYDWIIDTINCKEANPSNLCIKSKTKVIDGTNFLCDDRGRWEEYTLPKENVKNTVDNNNPDPIKKNVQSSYNIISETVKQGLGVIGTYSGGKKLISKIFTPVETQPEINAIISSTEIQKQLANQVNLINKANELNAKSLLGRNAYKKAYDDAISNGLSKKAAEKSAESAWKKVTGEKFTSNSFLSNLKKAFTSGLKKQTGGVSAGIVSGIYAAAGAYTTLAIFKLAGAGEKNMEKIKKVALYTSLAALGGSIIAGAKGFKFSKLAIKGFSSPAATIFLGAMAAVAITSAILYKNFAQESFNYKLSLWQPIPKGENCQECNDLEYGCSEYQCKSFGAACEILNAGTQKEKCDWVNKNDRDPPIITGTLDILNKGYNYNPNTKIKLPEKGITVEYKGIKNNCLPAFEGIEFGLTTNEPAQCKIDLNRTFSYDNMLGFMQEGSSYVYNHTFSLPNIALPSEYALSEAGYTIDEGNNYDFYIRCEDPNNNTSPYNYVVNFCVDSGPDTTAPTISTNYVNGAYIRGGQTQIDDLEVYTNEPAQCRWDFLDKDYKNMANEMTDCSTKLGSYTYPNSYLYGCRANLTGIKNNEINNYYIRCKDKPGLLANSSETRIENTESYVLSLEGTTGLVINKISLNNDNIAYTKSDGSKNDLVISDATKTVQVKIDVETSQGAGKEGNARCSYLDGGVNYEFYNNQNYDYTPLNNHYWNLPTGDYNYDITCCDLANNCDLAQINFKVNSDTNPPQVTRSYYENGLMKLVTNEEAECTYSLATCNYLVEDGLKIDTLDNINHFVDWNEKENFYVKCKDVYGNYPDPSECSIVVHPQYQYNTTL